MQRERSSIFLGEPINFAVFKQIYPYIYMYMYILYVCGDFVIYSTQLFLEFDVSVTSERPESDARKCLFTLYLVSKSS